MRDGGAALRADVDFSGTPVDVKPTHLLHCVRIPDLCEGGIADAAYGTSVQHIALAAGINVTVVFYVHRSAPEVMAWVFPISRGMAGIRAHKIGFIRFDAHLIDAGNVAPEAHEIVDLIPVALHADHLGDYLHLGPALLLHAGKADEVVAH